MIRLNLGCGFNHLKGYINIDSNPKTNPDRVMYIPDDLKKFEKDTIDEILMSAVVEHLDCDLVSLIVELKRILKPNGRLKILVPNCFYWKNRIKFLFGSFKAGAGYHYDHRWIFKPSFLKAFLEYYGFEVDEVSDLFDIDAVINARKRT